MVGDGREDVSHGRVVALEGFRKGGGAVGLLVHAPDQGQEGRPVAREGHALHGDLGSRVLIFLIDGHVAVQRRQIGPLFLQEGQ